MKTPPRALRAPLTAILLALTLAGCGVGGSDKPPTSTPAPGSTTTASDAVRPNGDFTVLTQVVVLDGCKLTLPMNWISFGDGTGETPSGARFTIDGGKSATDADWARAVQLVVDQGAADGATIEQGADWVLATAPDDRGFTFRLRADARYCDIAVTSVTAIPADEREVWPAIIGSLKGAPETLPTATTTGG